MNESDRITQLERQVRTLKRIVCLGGALVGLGVLVAASTPSVLPDVVKAREFQVVDQAGNTLVKIAGQENGRGRIETYDRNHKILATISSTSFGSGSIATFNQHAKTIVRISATDDGGGGIEIFDADQKSVFIMPPVNRTKP